MLVKTLYISGERISSILIADTFFTRLRGMLFRRPLPAALLISPTNAVHGFGMTRGLDVAFIDGEGTVLRTAALAPFGLRLCSRAKQVIEAPRGSFDSWNLTAGTRVEIS